MKRTYADVALLTESRYVASDAPEGDWYYNNILRDDALLQKALEERKITSERVNWADPDIDWTKFRCAVFRTTWDYFERIHEFTAWLRRTEKQIQICNAPDLIWWNLDKHYLGDLENRGVPVVSSRFIEKGSTLNLANLLSETGWNEGVIKPCISGAARHTYRVNHENVDDIQGVVQPFLKDESFLLQPFLRHIVETGEDTLMVLNGEVTHAVRKVAKPGDFRVQDDHGGTVHKYNPTNEQIKLALQAMCACEPKPIYGRVDMVCDNDGRWVVMEVELIEPELWLRFHPPASKQFAEAIEGVLDNQP